MKNFLFLFTIGIALFSCTSDDNDFDNTDPENSTYQYFPQHLDNDWEYETTQNSLVNTHFSGTAVVDGYTFNNLINQSPVFGFEGNSKVRKQGNKYYVSGELQYDQLPPIMISNQLFLDENAANGDIINEQTFTVELTPTDIAQGGITATVTPNVHLRVVITQENQYDQITLNGSQSYDNVLKMKWDYYLSCDLVFTNTGIFNINDHELIPEGYIGSLTAYYANNIGVARSEFDIDLSDLQFQTMVNTPAGTYDLEPYLTDISNNFQNSAYHNVSELVSYIIY